jgi:REP element-mobilizing transposase RayT
VFVAGASYHVYCRVARGERVFADPREAAALVGVIREVVREHGLSVLAWCVMATHYHLAVRAGRLPLWRSMRLIQGRFARLHNRRRRVLGPFWQGRYKAIVVADERYLRQLVAYIHLNPVAAGAVADPARYRWSGHRELLGRGGPPLVDAAEALVLFGARREAARRAYVRAIKGERREAWIGERPGALPWWRAGEADAEITLPEGRPRLDALGASSQRETARWPVRRYLVLASVACGMDREALAGRGKDAALTRARELVTLVGVEVYRQRVSDLAAAMGMNAGSVSRTLARAIAREREEKAFHQRRLALEEHLAEVEASESPKKVSW